MKRIETRSGYDYEKLFDAVVDRKNNICSTVGRDEYGNFILHVSEIRKSSFAGDEYYTLTDEEYMEFLKNARENRRISWFLYRKLVKINSEKKMPAGKIISFEIITLHISGMRFNSVYEIVMKEDGAEVSKYNIHFSREYDEKILEKRVICSETEILELLNDCRVLSWNGFHGSHPKGIKDGTMFSFKALVNGRIKISANGSQNFPKHYRDLTDRIHDILS